jgi:hypothetical protein
LLELVRREQAVDVIAAPFMRQLPPVLWRGEKMAIVDVEARPKGRLDPGAASAQGR